MDENIQQDQVQNQGENMDQSVQMSEDSSKSIGGIIAAIIIVAIIIVGGIYIFIGGGASEAPINPNGSVMEDTLPTSDESAPEIGTQGTTDDLTEIEEDLSSTVLEGLDAELEEIEAEIDAAL